MKQETKSICCDCGITHGPVFGPFTGKVVLDACCERCYDARIEAQQNAAYGVKQAQKAQSEAVSGNKKHGIPSEFMDSDLDRFPDSIRHLAGWTATDGRGLGIVGKLSLCKSRLAAHILNRHVNSGMRCLWLPCSTVGKMVTDQYGDDMNAHEAKRILKRAMNCDLLVLDDLGKGRSTQAVDETFFAIIDGRTANGLPIIWTANGAGSFIIQIFGDNMGGAIYRRLAQFTDITQAQ